MSTKAVTSNAQFRHKMLTAINGPQMQAILPAVWLCSYWLGGETALIAVAILMPAVIVLLAWDAKSHKSGAKNSVIGASLRGNVESALDDALQACQLSNQRTAAMVVELDDYVGLVDRLGRKACDDIIGKTADRLNDVLRDHDVVVRLDGATFAIALAPAKRADLETLIQVSGRIQTAVSEPISLDATRIYVSCSVGFCLGVRAPKQTGEAILTAAEQALAEAKLNGPCGVRGFSIEMQSKAAAQSDLVKEVSAALEDGQIQPWFQPQISTDTGEITGFEALARWQHPKRGMIAPAGFLPAIEQAGLSERLGEVILYHSLSSLKMWNESGINVPHVGVNFSGAELRNPKLVDKIRWELDRFELDASRLTVEVLETVVADTGDDIITRNIAGLAKLGCAIDLDDFGTGHASIANIRRFSVGRIKIDRSFVMKVDTDPDQQRMVSAILTMADQLGLQTLGEGVETVGEHAMLAQLGCGHVQGFGLARPMPFADTLDWMRKHQEKLGTAPQIGRRAG